MFVCNLLLAFSNDGLSGIERALIDIFLMIEGDTLIIGALAALFITSGSEIGPTHRLRWRRFREYTIAKIARMTSRIKPITDPTMMGTRFSLLLSSSANNHM